MTSTLRSQISRLLMQLAWVSLGCSFPFVAERFGNAIMTAKAQAGNRQPVCGISSLVAPFGGLALGWFLKPWLMPHAPDGMDGLARALFAGLGLLLAAIGGAILAVVALRRGERYRAVGWAGLLLNLLPLLGWVWVSAH